jgi:hypothetical protein
MAPPAQSALRSLDLIVHHTDHDAPEGQHIQTIFRDLVDDDTRTRGICRDIHEAIGAGRNCLVLTRWTEHLNAIAAGLTAENLEPLVLHGQMGKKARTAIAT